MRLTRRVCAISCASYFCCRDLTDLHACSGKNVCLFYLIGSCRFGDAKCNYSHTKDYLPEHGFWSDREELRKVQTAFSEIERQKRLSKRAGRHKKPTMNGLGRLNPLARSMMVDLFEATIDEYSDTYGDDDNDVMEQRMMNGGFSNSEMDELLSQGVKPWDDDAWVSSLSFHQISQY